mmetsp:Transcript_22185/g.61763  ORF Transcript_22185/g.61763 Transcript_22185/m.61763 type:complete len:491 (+) Transcript_22185:448-1920(+)|eukprot:CAMPEP_0172380282 /NCGR_PEP_ID=MMETSP1060-20121228/70360_1 /TAXON_ID=37318 /ORGANISM="Pseudo-nitzschia pungens, Strain cf. cingulata" /LENGTH=490 /DNA_ID=CAMNT_0013108035 /DNA_START=795 /DNA_END=2267 /DNA_ORIENTATION=-
MSKESSPASSNTKQREWDLVIYGATGDAGKAIAWYIANNVDSYKKSTRHSNNRGDGNVEVNGSDSSIFRWAIAGRSGSKLNTLRSQIIVGRSGHSTVDEIGILTADSTCPNNTNQLAKSARLVVSAVGPYTRLGENIYAACVENGTNYVDITGEVDWVLHMREKYGERARETGSTLCSFSGYDSVPSDITIYAARRVLSECDATDLGDASDNNGEVSLSCAETVVEVNSGAMPRGTIRTMITKLPDGPQFCRDLVRFASSKNEGSERMVVKSLVWWLLPRWSADYGAFTLPHFMGWCNIPVVYNSCSSIDCTYHDRIGIPFSQGCLGTGYGLLQTLVLYLFLLATAPFFLIFQTIVVLVPSLSEFLLKAFDSFQYRGNTPQNQKLMENSTVDVWTYATSASSGSQARVHLHVKGDAGIKCTALLACETAFSILELDDANKLPRGVIGSPSMIAGDALVDRLQDEDAIGDFCTLTVTVVDGEDDNDTKKKK